MQRIDTATRAEDLFGPGKDGFTDGDPETALAPTHLNAAFFNSVQEELATVVEAFGPLDPAGYSQVYQALSFAFDIMAIPSMVQRGNTGDARFRSAAGNDEGRIVVICDPSLPAGAAMTFNSSDGRSFSAIGLGDGSIVPPQAICWAPGPGLFVIVAAAGEIHTSPDTGTWTKRLPQYAFAGEWKDVAANHAIIVAVCGTEVQTSVDGVTWLKRVHPSNAKLVTWSDRAQRFLTVGADNQIATSPDGITWTALSDAPEDITALGAGPAGFIAGNELIQKLMFSVDGSAWTVFDVDYDPRRITRGGVIVGTQGFGTGVLALGPGKQRRIGAAVSFNFYKIVRTPAFWVAGDSDGKIYVSQMLPF